MPVLVTRYLWPSKWNTDRSELNEISTSAIHPAEVGEVTEILMMLSFVSVRLSVDRP